MFHKISVKMFSFLFILLLLSFTSTKCERLHEQIYSSIEGGAACFRRLNGTHQVGCSSSENGVVGVVQMVRNIEDAEWIVTNSTAGKYAAIVSTSLFNNVIELFMEQPDNVAGVILYENATEIASHFSEDSRCPNEYSSGPGSQCSSEASGGIVWNDKGMGLLRRDIPFPIFYLPESKFSEILKIDKCYQRYNTDKSLHDGWNPLCSVQLSSFMYAAISTEVCMRRSAGSSFTSSTKVCDPLGDQNVYYSLFPRTKESTKTESVTLVTARIDTASLFDGVTPGVASSAIGMITLLTTAVTLAKMIPIEDAKLYKENILFTLFNGESFDYIGSQRVAYDVSRGAWPAAPLARAALSLHAELAQLGGALPLYDQNTAWPLFTYAPQGQNVTEVTDFLNILTSNANSYNMSVTPKFDNNLPPSSLHSFRRILNNVTENQELLEVLIADHGETFTNMYYNSALDDYKKIGFNYHNISIGTDGTFITTEDLLKNGNMTETEVQVKISRLATALARTLYQRVTGTKYDGNLTASAHMVDEMIYCFVRSQACRLLLAADYAQTGGNEDKVEDRPASLYVGVASWAGPAPVFAGHLLALLAGARSNDNRTACAARQQPGFSYYWLKGWNHTGECIQTTMNFSQAVSPAFTIPDYLVRSGEFSSWSESVWAELWARVFVSAGGRGARAALAAGVTLTAAAALLTYWLKKHAALVFAPPAVDIDDAASGILRTVNC